ncbi:hypothetical protein GGI12_000430 [Dipsacomyces acuminosporus]|nr:hypothetical protein GGI12_000430 [Dipsacomyces acuminosporus]
MTGVILKSKYEDISIPLVDLPSFFFQELGKCPEFSASSPSSRPVFIDGSEGSAETLTAARLQELTRQVASGLYNELGVRRNDVVAVVLPNSIYYIVFTMAVLMVGGTCTVVNPAYTSNELEHQLKDSAAKFVISTDELLPTVSGAIKDIPSIAVEQHVLVTNRERRSEDFVNVRSVYDVLSDDEYPRVHLNTLESLTTTTAYICYSSGTTGLPKGVQLSHYNIVANILQGGCVLKQMVPPEGLPRTTIAILPMFHSFGMVFMTHGMPLCGSTLVVMEKFEMKRFLTLIQQYKVTDTMLVPPIINALVKLPMVRQFDLSSLTWIISGAAPLSTSTIVALESLFGNINVMQGYGLTETSPGISVNSPALKNANASGPLLPNIHAKVIDDQGSCLEAGQVGELCFRGPNIMIGYLNNEDATKEAIDEDGFLHTGDIGYIDEERFVYVTDRKKELVKFNGFQVAPAELEGILLQHPSVADCAVFGVFDEKRQTEVPRAHLVLVNRDEKLKGSLEDIASEVVEWMNKQVAYYKHLRGGYAIVDSIPKSASGKILRRLLQ